MLIFVTNVWNHYMPSMCPHLAEALGEDNFRLLLVAPVKEEPSLVSRLSMGWKMDVPQERWVVRNPETKAALRSGEYCHLIETADVAIIESLFNDRKLFGAISRRVAAGRLTFFANERFLKYYLTVWDCLNPRNWVRWIRINRRFSRSNVHYLPEDHWGRDDMRFLGACRGRIWQFGCFPPVSPKPATKSAHAALRIGWCGNMMRLKHVDHIIRAVAKLPREYRDKCHISLIGQGEHRDELGRIAADLGMDALVEFLPYQPLEKVKQWMEQLDVYMFPSDIREGWGVVVAEAMDKCCVPIACVDAGVTLDLIDDGYNGFVHEQADLRRMGRKLMWLIDHPDERREMGLNAWKTMQDRAPEKAAKRCLAMIRAVQTGDYSLAPQEGPFSNIG